MKSEWIQIRVSPELKERLRVVAQSRGVSLSKFIIDCVEEVLK
jgi:predicted HicB family RNase H-like nuclease